MSAAEAVTGNQVGNSAPPDQIVNEWFPVATCSDVAPGAMYPFRLLDRRYVLLCGADGVVTVFEDICPHRGAQLSLGTFDGARVQCPYHGWEFATSGACEFRPAHPSMPIPDACRLTSVQVRRAYDLYWVCVGPEPRNLPTYEAFGEHPGLTVVLGPKPLAACGPRIVENFLDVAHFPYVHANYLGQVPHTEVKDYDVANVDGELHATNVIAWQPKPGPTAVEGGDVAYVYGVSHPYAAILTKVPTEANGGELGGFSLMLVASPEDETHCRVWMLTTINDPAGDLQSFLDFNTVIFSQDVDIVESQLPKRLPIDPRLEMHQRADRMSLAYRRWLADRGIRYGTTLND